MDNRFLRPAFHRNTGRRWKCSWRDRIAFPFSLHTEYISSRCLVRTIHKFSTATIRPAGAVCHEWQEPPECGRHLRCQVSSHWAGAEQLDHKNSSYRGTQDNSRLFFPHSFRIRHLRCLPHSGGLCNPDGPGEPLVTSHRFAPSPPRHENLCMIGASIADFFQPVLAI